MDDLIESARAARKWGRPVTDDEADGLLAELDAARTRIAGQAAEIERLRAVAELTDAHVKTIEAHGALRWAGIPALRAALDATSTREDQP